ncbi:MAG TPA: glycerate kinase [Longimicrobiales bacterium]|nr:glycerate kinase [Longimicrobiales bacterium]
MILICPTAFKGTLTPSEAAAALVEGARRAVPGERVIPLPLSDGGSGLLDTLRGLPRMEVRGCAVAGPLGAPVRARWLHSGERVVVESAQACGIQHVPAHALDPLRATTRGVGELIARARAAAPGAELVLGLGGSATVDGGLGMAAALGWRLLGDDGRPVPPGGRGLLRLARIRPSPAAEGDSAPGRILALADVDNPLTGPRGAARVYGPQKGATPAVVAELERGLERLAERLRVDLGVDIGDLAGAGAAGGLGAAAVAFLGAALVPGSRWVLDALDFEARLADARLVVTGEGAVDAQTGMGKIVGEVLARARVAGVPALVVAGRIEGELPPGAHGVDGGGGSLDGTALASLAEEGVRALSRAAGPG